MRPFYYMEERVMPQIVIITGGTSGIGEATARLLAKNDCKVYEFSRREANPDYATHMRVDVSNAAQVKEAVDRVIAKEGRVDILINNAGMGISGAFEFTEESEARRLMDINLFGMNNTIRAVLPHMRKARSGRIVNLSSVAGVYAIPFQAWYSISKAGVRAMSLAVANEIKPYGVKVTCILPGDIHTGFTAARAKSIVGDDVYGGRIEKSVKKMEHDEETGITPEAAGRIVARVALKKNPAPEYTIGFVYMLFVFLGRLLPKRAIRSILGIWGCVNE